MKSDLPLTTTDPTATEVSAVVERYARRDAAHDAKRYSQLMPAVYLSVQERERALIRLIHVAGLSPLDDKRVLEIGCGSGSNILQLIKLGFTPANFVANELLEERIAVAKHRVPSGVRMIPGNALALDLPDGSFDIVFQSTVFTSILDKPFQEQLAGRLWRWVKPGGGVIWYDFTYDNPANPDVRGIPLSRVKALFPKGRCCAWRVTLAPPIARRVTEIHPSLYTIFNVLPVLRTHVLCWIAKF